MSEFVFLKNNPKNNGIFALCTAAESATEPAKRAEKCRDALGGIISYIFERYGVAVPFGATMLELIDGKIISAFVNNPILLESIHFIRKLGINAGHGLHIKKAQSKLALDNLVFFTRYTVNKFDAPEKVKDYVLPPYMSEAETRRIYIDLYLGEVGWSVMPPNSTKILPGGTSVACGTVFPSRACCEIPVDGMPNKSGIGFCDYVLYGKDGKPLAIVEAKKTSAVPLVGQEQVKVYGDCMKAIYGYIPVLYYTNGYEIYVIDGTYPSRRVMSFHTLEELTYLLQKRERGSITDLSINDDISSRP